MKAAREAVDGLSQDFFSFDVEEARQIDQGKKQIAQLFARARFVAGFDRVFQFANLFFHFAPDRLDVGPIETQMRGSSRDALGAGQCRHRLGNVAERRFRFAVFSLACFDLQPLLQHRCRILGQRFAGEHVGVAADEFFRKQSNNIFHGKASFFRGDLGVKDDLQQYVAQFLF